MASLRSAIFSEKTDEIIIFFKWVGECLTTFANGVAGTTQELLAKISEGLKGDIHDLFFGIIFLSEIDWDRFVADSKDFGAQILNGIRDFGSDN